MSLLNAVDLNADYSGALSAPVCIAHEPCMIESLQFVSPNTVAKHAVNYTTVEFIDRGVDGTGSTVIATFNTNDADPDAIDITGFVQVDLETNNYELQPGSVIEAKKTDAAGAVNLGIGITLFGIRRIG